MGLSKDVLRDLLFTAAVVASVALSACDDQDKADKTSNGSEARSSPRTEPTSAGCPVTPPNGETPPGGQPGPEFHGNGDLWTALPSGAKPDDVRENGSSATKFPWWRGPGAKGQLRITGQRLQGRGPPIRPRIPAGYGRTGFQASAVIFPRDGCWEITGKAGDAALTAVIRVRSQP